jgi:hypothetical protein
MKSARDFSTVFVSRVPAKRVTKGSNSLCRKASGIVSFKPMAYWAMGREKHAGQSPASSTDLYLNPAAMIAASLMHVPPSGPGKSWLPSSSFQFRIVSNLRMSFRWNLERRRNLPAATRGRRYAL